MNNKKSIFSTAWNNARNAAKLFGGKASEYFAECLKAVYKLMKSGETVTIVANTVTKAFKKYVAKKLRNTGKVVIETYFCNESGCEYYGRTKLADFNFVTEVNDFVKFNAKSESDVTIIMSA